MKNIKLMNIIGDIDDKYIIEAEPKGEGNDIVAHDRKTVSKFKLVSIVACFTVIIAATIFYGNDNWVSKLYKKESQLPIADNGLDINHQDTPNVSIDPPNLENLKIVINKLKDKPQADMADIGLFWEDAISKSPIELQEYYGTEIYPTNLPDDFRKEMIKDESLYGQFWIFKRDNGEIYYDQNTILYESKEGADFHDKHGYKEYSLPSIEIILSKERPILLDYLLYESINKNPEKSTINGYELIINTFNDEYGVNYVSHFVKDDVYFEVYGYLISQDEFVDLLISYFE